MSPKYFNLEDARENGMLNRFAGERPGPKAQERANAAIESMGDYEQPPVAPCGSLASSSSASRCSAVSRGDVIDKANYSPPIAFRPAAVILMRTTSTTLSPPITASCSTAASPRRTSPPSTPRLNPCP
jgi:hypothetical protein